MRDNSLCLFEATARGQSMRRGEQCRAELSATWKCHWEHGRPASPARWSDRCGQCTLCYPCIGARVAGIGSCRHLDIDRLAMVDCPRRATALTDPQSMQANLCAMPATIISPWGHPDCRRCCAASLIPSIPSPVPSASAVLTLTLLSPSRLTAQTAAANLDMPAQLLSLP